MMSLERARKAALEKSKKPSDQQGVVEESVARRVKKTLQNFEKAESQRQESADGKKSLVFSTITEFTRGINVDNSLGVAGAHASTYRLGSAKKGRER